MICHSTIGALEDEVIKIEDKCVSISKARQPCHGFSIALLAARERMIKLYHNIWVMSLERVDCPLKCGCRHGRATILRKCWTNRRSRLRERRHWPLMLPWCGSAPLYSVSKFCSLPKLVQHWRLCSMLQKQ